MLVLLFDILLLFCVLTGSALFSGVGHAVCTFMYGTFGYGCYLVIAALAYLGVWLIADKSIKLSIKSIVFLSLSALCLFCVFQAVSAYFIGIEVGSFGAFLADSYYSAQNGLSGYTCGGVISSLFVYPISKIMTYIGAYIVYAVLFIVFAVLSYMAIRADVNAKKVAKVKNVSSYKPAIEKKEDMPVSDDRPKEQEVYAENMRYQYPYPEQMPMEPAYAGAYPPVDDMGAEEYPNSQNTPAMQNSAPAKPKATAMGYSDNLMFDETSYFNHPIHSIENYYAGLGISGAPAVNTDGTLSSDYMSDGAPEQYENVNYIFGEQPILGTDDLEAASEQTHEAPRERAPRQSSIPVESVKPAEDETRETKDEPVRNFTRDTAVPEKTQPEPESKDFPRLSRRRDMDFENIVPDEQSSDVRGVTDKKNDNFVPERGRFTQDDINVASQDDDDDGFSDDFFSSRGRRVQDLFDDDYSEESEEEEPIDRFNVSDDDYLRPTSRSRAEDVRSSIFGDDAAFSETDEQPEIEEEPERPRVQINFPKGNEDEFMPPQKHDWKPYNPPSLDLLDTYNELGKTNAMEIEMNKAAIVDTLAEYKIDSEIMNVKIGCKVTRYDVMIKDKKNISNVMKYVNNIQFALKQPNINAYINYRMEAFSVEVPNRESGTIGLSSLLSDNSFINSKPGALVFGLGKTMESECKCLDITKMPHLLIAGTTGSGKSVCLNTLLVSLLYKYGPEDLRLILVDPKQVEFIAYDKLPQLMINEILHDVDKVIKALNWAIKEMERRYEVFSELSRKGIATKDINEYNSHVPEGEQKMCKIVIVLDEFGDLMMMAKKEIESRIVRLAQKARACGIHLILATQRPSVDVVTGLIKSNLPARICFKVNSFKDATTVFDKGGAEKLLGSGDMYFKLPDKADLERVQGCYISSDEVQRVTDYVKQHNETFFDQNASNFINAVKEEVAPSADDSASDDSKIDETYIRCLKACILSKSASVNMLQRKFGIGYMKACKIIDWMESMNYISQNVGSKPRSILLSMEEFISIYGDIED